MADPKSLCRVDWKLGQALMPAHFLWQEDSLRSEFETRFEHQARPMWGVVKFVWDETILHKAGRLIVRELQLVLETGLLIDVPGNARPVSLDLVEDEDGRADVYLYLVSSPDLVRGTLDDQEGSLIELRMQKLELSQKRLKTPQPGFHLGRFSPARAADGEQEPEPKQNQKGWRWDPSYVPPLVTLSALPAFADARVVWFNGALAQWVEVLRTQALENSIAVHKRVEAQLLLRSAYELQWFLHQLAPNLESGSGTESEDSQQPALKVHPYEFFERVVRLYLDIFSFRTTPQQTLLRTKPLALLYQHQDVARCFEQAEAAIQAELERPRSDSPQWPFSEDISGVSVCELPQGLRAEAELYFLIQFTRGSDAFAEEAAQGLDSRLLGLKLAEPSELEAVERRALTGIPFVRVRLVPFPHNFDSTVTQFYRLLPCDELTLARKARQVAFRRRKRPIQMSFLYSPDASAV